MKTKNIITTAQDKSIRMFVETAKKLNERKHISYIDLYKICFLLLDVSGASTG